MKRVLFVGDINVDLIFGGLQGSVQPDREITCREFSRSMGSSAVISAVAFSQLGGNAGFCGLSGKDDDGRFMTEGMKSRGIDISLVEISPDLPTGVTLCRALSITTSLDTQWDSSEAWEGLNQWLELIDYLFVNKDEALSISGMTDVDDALDSLIRQTGEVLIKTGPDGAVGATGTQRYSVPSPDVEVKDTTGAGDTFAAGFLKKRVDTGGDFLTAMEYASAAAAFSCTFSGGVSDTICDAEVTRLMQNFQL